jgi:HAMP domain-containing protein
MTSESPAQPLRQQQARRTTRLALLHLALALGILALFVWSTVHRAGG